MTVRRFGPIRAAGTGLIERDTAPGIQPSPLGNIAYVGVLEKGPTGKLISVPKQRDFLRQCGTYRDDSECPDAAMDFYKYSQGAGQLFVVRVTDGNEIQALDYVTSRHTGTGEYVDRETQAQAKGLILLVKAKNGGRWGGSERVLSQDFTIATDLTETTLATGQTMLVNEYAGAILKLLGVTDRTYTVVSNTTAGVLTVETGSTMASDLAASATPTNNTMLLMLEPEDRAVNGPGLIAGTRHSLALEWRDGVEDPDTLFGLALYVDEKEVKKWDNLSLDPASKWYLPSIIAEDPDNYEIEVTVQWLGAPDAAHRPANWYSEYKAYAGGVATAQVCHVVSVVPNTPGNDIGFVTKWLYRARLVRQRLTLTFTGSTTFTVATTATRGAEQLNLPNGTVGTAYATTLAANDRTLLDTIPTFTVYRGVDAFEAGDVIVIDVDPFPVNFASGLGRLVGKKAYTTANSSRERVEISENTVNTLTFNNLPPTAPTPADDIQADITGTDITFSTAGGDLELLTDTVGFVTLSYGVNANIAALVAELNGLATAAGLPATLFSNTGNALKIQLASVYSASSTQKGRDQFFEIVTAPAELNLTEQLVHGTPGDAFRIEAPRELREGYDGDVPGSAEYLTALNSVTSPLRTLKGRKLGQCFLAVPGVVTTAVQKQLGVLAALLNYEYELEIPAGYVSETTAIAYVKDTIGKSDYGHVLWPSYANVVNPLGRGTVLRTLTGKVHGLIARFARVWDGYHKAAAGLDAAFPDVVTLPTGLEGLEIDEEQTNPAGLNILKKKDGNYVLWGDRSLATNDTWQFVHSRRTMSHYENTLIESFDWIIFALNDPVQQQLLKPVFDQFFGKEYRKRALTGASPEEAFQVKIDDENNPLTEIAAGNMHADLTVRIVGVVERLIISIGPAGLVSA